MADALGQTALAIESFGLAHLVGIALQFLDDVAHLVKAARGIVGDGLAQLSHAQFHVVEVGDGLAQLLGHIHQHFLEVAECLAAVIGALGGDGLAGHGVRDVHHHAPVALGPVSVIGLTIAGLDELQHFTVDVIGAAGFQLAADVGRHYLDVVLQQVHVLENGVVNALQHIVGRAITIGDDVIGVVDEAVTQGLDFLDLACYLKLCQYAGCVDRFHLH